MLRNMSGFFARYMVHMCNKAGHTVVSTLAVAGSGFYVEIQIYFRTVLYSNALSLLTMIYTIQYHFYEYKIIFLAFSSGFPLLYFIVFTATFLVFVFYCLKKKIFIFVFFT